MDTRLAGAKQLFTSLRDKFLILSDHVQVHPGHSAGSAGGKALGAIPSPTVGYERLYSWWGPYLAVNDEEGFINELLGCVRSASLSGSSGDSPLYGLPRLHEQEDSCRQTERNAPLA